jgi:hypothetical protein
MREIKFRAWNPYHKRMMLERTLYELTKDTWSSQCYDHLMQFTGLHDKNGKEIYEGDICSHKYYASPVVISFEDGAFAAEDVYLGDPSIEVIGNIYENPKLAK